MKNKTAVVFHGYGGEPAKDRARLLRQKGYNVIYPHIDYDKEWNLDKCKSLTNRCIELSKGADLIIGLSLGGHLAYLVSNFLNIRSVLINPAIDRDKTSLMIKWFDLDLKISNPQTDIFFGENDTVVRREFTIDYLDSINYKYTATILENMEHRCPFGYFRKISDMCF